MRFSLLLTHTCYAHDIGRTKPSQYDLMLHNGSTHNTLYMGTLHIFSPYDIQAISLCALHDIDNTHAMSKYMFPLHLFNEHLGDNYLRQHVVDKHGKTPTAMPPVLYRFHGDVDFDLWKDLPQGGGDEAEHP